MLHPSPSTSHFHCCFQNLYSFHSQLSTVFAVLLVASGFCFVFHFFKFYLLKVCKLLFDVHNPSFWNTIVCMHLIVQLSYINAFYTLSFVYTECILYIVNACFWMVMNGWFVFQDADKYWYGKEKKTQKVYTDFQHPVLPKNGFRNPVQKLNGFWHPIFQKTDLDTYTDFRHPIVPKNRFRNLLHKLNGFWHPVFMKTNLFNC